MPTHKLPDMRHVIQFSRISALTLLLLSGTSQAQIFKCESASGKVEYQAAPCAPGDKARELSKAAPTPQRQGSAGLPAEQDPRGPSLPSAATAEASGQPGNGCTELERRLKANANEIREAIDFWHREMTVFGKDSPRTRSIFNKLSNLRIDRTMLAQNAYPTCDFARRGHYRDMASGKRIPEEVESGLSVDTIRKCDAMRTQMVALRARTGRYPGAGRPGLWTGDADSPMAKELLLEDQMNSLRCPQFGPPMGFPH